MEDELKVLVPFGRFLSAEQLTEYDLHPPWAPADPTDDRIAFDRFTTDGRRAIWLIDPDTAVMTELSHLPSGGQIRDGHPSLSSDRLKIVFTREDPFAGTGVLYTMDADGGSQTALSSPAGPVEGWDPCWSPDRSRIAFHHNYQVWVTDADGSNPRPILDYSRPEQKYVLDHMPCWSPDSKRIAFCREHGGGGVIAVANADGSSSSPTMITTPLFLRLDAWPSWSTKDRIAFWRNDGTAAQIWTTSPTTGVGEVAVSHPRVSQGWADFAPSWSPDGDQIAFSRTSYGEYRIWVMNADGSFQHQISSLPPVQQALGVAGLDAFPSWA